MLAVAANLYLATLVLPGLTIVLGMAFLLLILLNLRESARRISARLIKVALFLEVIGLSFYALAHWDSIRHWMFDEGTTSHLFIFLVIVAIIIGFLVDISQQHDVPVDVNPG
jgi:hypothetical protein